MGLQKFYFLKSAGDLLLCSNHGHPWHFIVLCLHRLQIRSHIYPVRSLAFGNIYISSSDQMAFVDIPQGWPCSESILVKLVVPALVDAWNQRIAPHWAQPQLRWYPLSVSHWSRAFDQRGVFLVKAWQIFLMFVNIAVVTISFYWTQIALHWVVYTIFRARNQIFVVNRQFWQRESAEVVLSKFVL